MIGQGLGAAVAGLRGGDGGQAFRGFRGGEDGGEIVGDGGGRAGQEGGVDRPGIAHVDEPGEQAETAAEAFEADAVLCLFRLQGQDEDRDALGQRFKDQELAAVADDQRGARQDALGGQEVEDGEACRVLRQGGEDGGRRLSAEGQGDRVTERPQNVDQTTQQRRWGMPGAEGDEGERAAQGVERRRFPARVGGAGRCWPAGPEQRPEVMHVR